MFFRLLIACTLLLCVRAQAAPILHQGFTTYYHANAAAACALGASIDYTMTTAMGLADYDNSTMCGAYLRIIGPKGEAVVRVVDICGSCKAGDLDLNQEAFEKIADLKQGQAPIRWHIISPSLNTMTQYHFKEGSNVWWTAIQIRNHRNPVAKLEFLKPDGSWGNIERVRYNYFVQKKPGMGAGPYTLRVTDSYGNSLMDKNIALSPGETVEGKYQFPFESTPEYPAGTAVMLDSHVPDIRRPPPKRLASNVVRAIYVPQPKPSAEGMVQDDEPTPALDDRSLEALVNSRPNVPAPVQDEVLKPDESNRNNPPQDPPSDAQDLDQLVNRQSAP